MAKKVLIVYATGGMGHVTAAKAVQQAFEEKYPEVEIKNVDVIDYANGLYKKVFVDGYNYVSAKKPEMWGWLYRKFNKPSRQKLPTALSKLAIEGKFIPFIKDFKPDFIVSTHPLPMLLVSSSKRKEVIDIYSSMVVTDFGCHSFWVDLEVNYYFTATNDVGKCLQNYGVKPDQVVATGIPIHPKFSKSLDRQSLQQKFGLNPNLFTLLIVGGQFSFAALTKVINGVEKKHAGKVQYLVVAGRDQELKAAIENSDLDKKSHTKVFGFVDNMEELMTVSDIIFSKAGGLTVSECMAKGLPMIINKVIPGQEEDNVDYLVNKNAAVKVNNFGEVSEVVSILVNDPQRLTAMKAAAKAIGKPASAVDLADFVVRQIKN
ncbi:MAG: glycosyltransferase [Patescibacteria group bacterium]|jgi:processive 1,2-diacylglycerol beta-glucosyltransferase|nr:glycosyltransferase [Patescibacteria group bacterium]